MKKMLSLLLCACLALSFCTVLASCGHSHTFKADWSVDASHHWRACEQKDCEEISEKAEHTWDEGKITFPATVEVPGEKVYTCTVCGTHKTESIVIKTTVTDEEWAQALALNNYTVSVLIAERDEQDSFLMKVTENAMHTESDDSSYFVVKKNDGWHMLTESGTDPLVPDTAATVGFALNSHPLPANASFIYDQNTMSYIFETEETTVTENDISTKTYADKYIFYFEDEKLVKFEFCEGGYTQFTADMSGIVYDDIRSGQPTYTCVFSNYGTTAVELPTA